MYTKQNFIDAVKENKLGQCTPEQIKEAAIQGWLEEELFSHPVHPEVKITALEYTVHQCQTDAFHQLFAAYQDQTTGHLNRLELFKHLLKSQTDEVLITLLKSNLPDNTDAKTNAFLSSCLEKMTVGAQIAFFFQKTAEGGANAFYFHERLEILSKKDFSPEDKHHHYIIAMTLLLKDEGSFSTNRARNTLELMQTLFDFDDQHKLYYTLVAAIQNANVDCLKALFEAHSKEIRPLNALRLPPLWHFALDALVFDDNICNTLSKKYGANTLREHNITLLHYTIARFGQIGLAYLTNNSIFSMHDKALSEKLISSQKHVLTWAAKKSGQVNTKAYRSYKVIALDTKQPPIIIMEGHTPLATSVLSDVPLVGVDVLAHLKTLEINPLMKISAFGHTDMLSTLIFENRKLCEAMRNTALRSASSVDELKQIISAVIEVELDNTYDDILAKALEQPDLFPDLIKRFSIPPKPFVNGLSDFLHCWEEDAKQQHAQLTAEAHRRQRSAARRHDETSDTGAAASADSAEAAAAATGSSTNSIYLDDSRPNFESGCRNFAKAVFDENWRVIGLYDVHTKVDESDGDNEQSSPSHSHR